eukprot:scaffold9445_cov59-Phaeocystis_antarctica.AAC.5
MPSCHRFRLVGFPPPAAYGLSVDSLLSMPLSIYLSTPGLHGPVVRYSPTWRAAMALAALSGEQRILFTQLRNVLDPGLAVALSSASNELRTATQALLQQLRADHEVAAALCLKVGLRSCKELREAKKVDWCYNGLSADDLALVGTLGSVLPALEKLVLREPAAGPDGVQRLAAGLSAGALPAVTYFQVVDMHMGNAGASALAAALGRGALPRLKVLELYNAAIGDTGLVALAPALRRLPALEELFLNDNPFGDEGLAALAPPPPAGAPPPPTGVLTKLKQLWLSQTQITDAGCATLAAALDSGALPALETTNLHGSPASAAGQAAVYDALARSRSTGQPRAGACPSHECKSTTACSFVLSGNTLGSWTPALRPAASWPSALDSPPPSPSGPPTSFLSLKPPARRARAVTSGHEQQTHPPPRRALRAAMALAALSGDEQRILFTQLCNVLDPGLAVALSSTCNELRTATQALLQQLRADHEVAAALCFKVGLRSCKELREAKQVDLYKKGLTAADLETLGTLGSVLPALETLCLSEPTVGPDGMQRLAEGLGAGALPAVTVLQLVNLHVGDAGASALATALGRGALPRLKVLRLSSAALGDAGLVALAPALRRLPALEVLGLMGSPIGDEGLAALVAPPPPAGALPPPTGGLAKLKTLNLGFTQVTDAGCAILAAALDSGALPALETRGASRRV